MAKVAGAVFFLLGAFILSITSMPFKYDHVRQQLKETVPGSEQVMALMRAYRPYTHLVVTDRPIYAFYADMPADPYLASISLKKVLVGILGAPDFLNVIQKKRPELVLFARFSEGLNKDVAPRIQKDYDLVCKSPDGLATLYALKTIKEKVSM